MFSVVAKGLSGESRTVAGLQPDDLLLKFHEKLAGQLAQPRHLVQLLSEGRLLSNTDMEKTLQSLGGEDMAITFLVRSIFGDGPPAVKQWPKLLPDMPAVSTQEEDEALDVLMEMVRAAASSTARKALEAGLGDLLEAAVRNSATCEVVCDLVSNVAGNVDRDGVAFTLAACSRGVVAAAIDVAASGTPGKATADAHVAMCLQILLALSQLGAADLVASAGGLAVLDSLLARPDIESSDQATKYMVGDTILHLVSYRAHMSSVGDESSEEASTDEDWQHILKRWQGSEQEVLQLLEWLADEDALCGEVKQYIYVTARRILESFRKALLQDSKNQVPKHILACFRKWDTEHTGTISRESLGDIFAAINPMFDIGTCLDELMNEMDTNRNGVIDYSEFITWIFQNEYSLDPERYKDTTEEGEQTDGDE